jgi:hypothetical protein
MRIVLQRRWAAPAAPPARVVVSFHHSGGLRAESLEASQLGTSHTLILEGNLAILAGFAALVGGALMLLGGGRRRNPNT